MSIPEKSSSDDHSISYTLKSEKINADQISHQTESGRSPFPNPKPMAKDSDNVTVRSESSVGSKSYYGWTCCPGRCFARLNKPPWLLFCLCMCSLTQNMLINAFIPVALSSLERRFRLRSLDLGVFIASYDLAVLVAQLPICYAGERGNKARFVAIGMFVMAIGSFVCTIPHFISHASTVINDTTLDVCKPDAETTSGYLTAPVTYGVFALLCIGQLLHGFGATPIFSLGVTYLDENVSRAVSPLYLGIFVGTGVLGPAIGYVLGGLMLQVYGDIGRVDLEQLKIGYEDIRWYGAWWVGFLVSSGFGIISSMLMLGFPRRLIGADAASAQENETVDVAQSQVPSFKWTTFKEMYASIQVLLKCKTFFYLIGVDLIESWSTSGLVGFFPKLLENFFVISSSRASLLMGASLVPAAVLGSILGGYLIKRLTLHVPGMLMLSMIATSLAWFMCLAFLAHCPQQLLAGVTFPYDYVEGTVAPPRFYQPPSLNHSCNSHCNCDDIFFNPVCDQNRSILYYSPCFAGCLSKIDTVYEDCQCVAPQKNLTMNDTFDWTPATVSSGFCPSKCSNLAVFLILFAFLVFFSFTSVTPVQETELRVVPYNYRTMAFGVRFVLVRLFAAVPGPMMFGAMVDRLCLLWISNKCSVYDNKGLSLILLVAGIVLKSSQILSLYLARRHYLKKVSHGESTESSGHEKTKN